MWPPARHGELPQAQLGQAQALNFLAGYGFQHRRIAQAEPQFLRAIESTERADGAASQRLLPPLDNLLALYRSQQCAVQAVAVAVAERVERLRCGQASPDLWHAVVRSGAGGLASRCGQGWSGLVRGLLRVPAVLSLDIGLLGVVTPGLLTPDFILLAAWAAARSSPRFHVWC